MSEYVQRQDAEDVIFFNSKYKAIKALARFRSSAKTHVYFYMLTSFLFSPFLFLLSVFYVMSGIWKELIHEYFYDPRKYEKYKIMFQPKSAKRVLTVVGYQVFEEEVQSHLGLVKNRSTEGAAALSKKQKEMESEKNAFRRVGFDTKLLLTHLLIPGKTGAGKTEGIRSIADDTLLNGGGFVFNDGKSDEKLMVEFQTQAKKAGRETSVQILNFLKAEKMAESNTFSPLGIMHPVKIVEFLGSLIKDGSGGDGNAEYFFNRGKAMMFPVVNATYIRDKYIKEGFSLEKVFENTNVIQIVLLYIAMYSMSKDINEKLKSVERISIAISSVTIVVSDPSFQAIEATIEYVTQNPSKKDIVREAGIDYMEIKEIYSNSFLPIRAYLEKVWNQYGPLLSNLGNAIYKMVRYDEKSFFGEDAINMTEIKQYYNRVKEVMIKADENAAKDLRRKYDFSTLEVQSLFEAFKGNKGTVENPPPDAIQQHAYAQQQFESLSGVFTMYKHIFGQSKPEIKPEKLIKDNKFLYILLPPLELQDSQVKILGKMIIMTIREIAAIALRGQEISVHKTLKRILKDKATPKPFTFVVLDEYGAYPVNGIDLLLAQLRSLRISVAIAVQDYASLQAGGNNKTSQERALANTTKWLLKLEDETAIKWIDGMLDEIKYETHEFERDAFGNNVQKMETKIEKKKALRAQSLRDFDNGFSVLLTGSDADGVVYLQSFYRGGKSDNISIKRLINLG